MKEDIKTGIYRIKSDASNVMLYVNGIATPLVEKSAANGQRFIIGDWKDLDSWLVNEQGTNITSEYLANTYGKIESKEHAEFIVELTKANNLDVYVDDEEIERNYFTFNQHGILFFYECSGEAVSLDRKQVTIPMPPKEADEWAKVGDQVCWSNGKRKGELKSICEGWAWIKDDSGEFVYLMSKYIKKPKTPEEEFREWLQERIGYGIASGFDCEAITHDLLHHCNITKKQ